MIILDTNVISALMRAESEQGVVDWLDRQPAPSIWTTTITIFEVRFGLEILPDSHRRRALEAAFGQALSEDFEGRVLPFDAAAAHAAASIAARQRKEGRPLEIRDVQIAGIAAARKATVATRNRHFEGLGIDLVNPWQFTP